MTFYIEAKINAIDFHSSHMKIHSHSIWRWWYITERSSVITESVQSPAVLEKCGLFAHKISRVDIVTESTEKQKS